MADIRAAVEQNAVDIGGASKLAKSADETGQTLLEANHRANLTDLFASLAKNENFKMSTNESRYDFLSIRHRLLFKSPHFFMLY